MTRVGARHPRPAPAEVFGGKNPVGNAIPQEKRRDGTQDPEMRVVGVVRAYRQDGELALDSLENYLFRRYTPSDRAMRPPDNLLLKLQPGTRAAFEEKLVRRLQAAGRDWSFEVETIDHMREEWITLVLGPLVAAAVIAGFLILMVGMGLTGVLWQTVTQRTREVGLRRAKGATIRDIRVQILGELVVMTSVALLAGTAVVALVQRDFKLVGFEQPAEQVVEIVAESARRAHRIAALADLLRPDVLESGDRLPLVFR